MIGCEFCIRDPEGPSEFCAACLIEQREHLRVALEDLLHVATYDQDPTANSQLHAVAEQARRALDEVPPYGSPGASS